MQLYCFKFKSLPELYSYRQNSLLLMQPSNFLKMCRIMIISVDFLEFHPISVMFSGYSNSTSMGMQLRAENRDSIDRKALDYDQNVSLLIILSKQLILYFFDLYRICLVCKYLPQLYTLEDNIHLMKMTLDSGVLPFCQSILNQVL